MAKPSQPSASPTLPLPPPRAASIPLEQFVEAISASTLRALASAEFNPQPEPPGKKIQRPWIWVGIIAGYGDMPSFTGGPSGPGAKGGK